jgi:GTPase
LTTHVVANVVNIATLGAGILVTAVPQGLMASYGSYVVGHAAKYYFEHGGSWGKEGPKAVVEQILAEADRGSVLELLRERIRGELQANRHAVARTL